MTPEPELTADFHLGFFAVGSILFARSLLACAAMRRVPFLPAVEPAETVVPILAVVVARSADDALRDCLDDLGRQNGVHVDTVVVDDRSTTPDAIAELSRRSADTRVVRIDESDDGVVPWAAAFSRGLAVESRGARWVLLLERPCRLPSADALVRAIHHAERERAAVLWMVPRSSAGPWLEPSKLTALADAMPAMAATNSDRESVHLPGLPCLGRPEALTEAIRDPRAASAAVLESRIAERLRDTDRRARCVFAADLLDAGRASPGDAREGIERLLAAIGFRPAMVVGGLAIYGLLWFPAVWGACSSDAWGAWAAGGLASLVIPAWLVASATRSNPLAAIAAPLAYPFEAIATIWIALRASRRGAVSWRGKAVPLERLRDPDSLGT